MTVPACSTLCGSGAPGAPLSAAKAHSALFTVPVGAPSQVPLTVKDFQVGPAISVDLANNRLVVNQDGLYHITVAEQWASDPNPVQFRLRLLFNAVAPGIGGQSAIGTPLLQLLGTLSGTFELAAGTAITLDAAFTGATDEVVLAASLAVEKLG